MESKSKDLDLEEWEDLMRHPHFKKVQEVLSQKIESLQSSVRNRAKTSMDLNTAVQNAGDLRAVSELEKVLQTFDSIKQQILKRKGV